MKTYTPKPAEIEREWFVVDAKDQTLGRLATQIAVLLRGKHKPIFAPHMDVGDFVIVVNANKIRVTGDKMETKMYYRHSGYPSGLKAISLRDQLARYPDRVIRSAVRGMLPKNSLGRQQLKKLKIYATATHPHEAQRPKTYEL
ncbi:MAG: 50S ribosomal protein L13 [Anaerolineae bacterium]|nr:50S ribosomal protein L13 [Anaerolineae bacterium]